MFFINRISIFYVIIIISFLLTACAGDENWYSSYIEEENINTPLELSLNIYCADANNMFIHGFNDMSGDYHKVTGGFGYDPMQFTSPHSVFVHTNGDIYVAEMARIVRIADMDCNEWIAYGSNGSGINQFYNIADIYVDKNGKIYLSDIMNHRIVRIDDMSGNGWITFGSNGTGTNQFDGPGSICLDTSNRIYITDWGNNRIVRINDMTGAGWVTLGSYGSGTNQFYSPSGICIGLSNKIYIADNNNNRIVRINDMTGAGWKTLGGVQGFGEGQFCLPGDIGVDSQERIYICDNGNYRIVRINNMSGDGWVTITAYNWTFKPSSIFVTD